MTMSVKEIYRILRHHDGSLKTLTLHDQWAESVVNDPTTRKAFLVTLVCLRIKAPLVVPNNKKTLTEAEVRATLPQEILNCTSLYVRAAVAIHMFPQSLMKQLLRDFVLAQLVIRSDTVNNMISTLCSEAPLTEEENAVVANGAGDIKRAKYAEDGNRQMLKVSPKRVRIVNTILREDVVTNIKSIRDRVKLGASIYSIVQMLVTMSYLARSSRYAKLAKRLDGSFYLDCVHHHVNLDEKIKLDDEFTAVRRANPDEPYRLLAPYEPLVESYYRATLPEGKVSEFMRKAKKDISRAPTSLLYQVLDRCRLESDDVLLHCYEIEIKKRKTSKSAPVTKNKIKDVITLNGDGDSMVEVYEGEPNYSDKLVELTQTFNGTIYHVTTIGGVLFNVRGSSSEFGGKRRCITYDNLPWSERLDLIQTTKIKLQRMTKAELARKVHSMDKNKQLSVSEKDADGFFKRFDVKASGAMNRKRKAQLQKEDAVACKIPKQDSEEEH